MGKGRAERILHSILNARGIVGDDAIREYLSEKPKLAYDPLLLPGMAEGAALLLEAVRGGKRVCVYGDYDVDGVTATALLVGFLRGLVAGGENGAGDGQGASGIDGAGNGQGASGAAEERITYYIPSRIEEGYGLNKAALLTIREGGADVVVTVDCGSVSAEEADYAREIGLALLITDHHAMEGVREPECIVINPKKPGSAYPYPNICGCAVAFKLACAVFDLAGKAPRAALHAMVDLVCVATIADVMPLMDENRTFVKHGLSLIRKGSRPALNALMGVAGIGAASVSVRDVAFGIAPRLNAAGRVGDASECVELFLTGDAARMRALAQSMDAANQERKGIQERCLGSCMGLVGEGQGFLTLRPDYAHEGVVGIVAGKVREATGLPCAVLAVTEDGMLKGSARSAGRFDLIAALRRHGELFEKLGGHSMAAGFLLKMEREGELRAALDGEVLRALESDPGLLLDEDPVDAELDAADIDLELAHMLGLMAPFGNGNKKPRVRFACGAGGIQGLRAMGQDGSHARFTAAGVPCVYFSGMERAAALAGGGAELFGSPDVNVWQGRESLQFVVANMHPFDV